MELSTKNFLRVRFMYIKVKANGGRKSYMVSPQGALTYFIGESFLEQARKLEIASDITLNLEGLRQIDHDALCLTGKVLTEWAKTITTPRCGSRTSIRRCTPHRRSTPGSRRRKTREEY